TCVAGNMSLNPATGLPNWITACPVTSYAYDTENNLTSITDALGRVTSFQYWPQVWMKETEFQARSGRANTQTQETYEDDAVGNLIKRIDRKRQEMDYRYDSLNCLISKTWAGANPPYSVTYTYDLASRLTQVTDPTGTYTFTSDNTGRFTATTVQYTA